MCFWEQAMQASATMPVFRALQQAVTKAHEDLASACDSNLYTLRYLCSAGQGRDEKHMLKRKQRQEREQRKLLELPAV